MKMVFSALFLFVSFGIAVAQPVSSPEGIRIEARARPVTFTQTFNDLRRSAKISYVYANSDGHTLYYSTVPKNGGHGCEPSCGDKWKPALYTRGIGATGDWSVITRSDGSRQWAYKKRLLYSFADDKAPGDVNGEGNQNWRVLVFDPGSGLYLPPGLTIVPQTNCSQAPTIANAAGLTLYTTVSGANVTSCAAGCLWKPQRAPQLAKSPDRNWSTASVDGTRVWVFRGKPLYAFAKDATKGDCRGSGRDGRVPAYLTEHKLPPEIKIGTTTAGTTAFTTKGGLTLYVRDIFWDRFSGDSNRLFAVPASDDGRLIATWGCDSACGKTWSPFLAPGSALPIGLWSVIKIGGNRSQWAYKGFPVYTYKAERGPGTEDGNDVFEYRYGWRPVYWRPAVP